MHNRLFHGAMALLASTALTQPWISNAQEAETAEETAAEDLTLGPVVVRGEFIPDEKRETSEVASLVDAEDFAIRGDSDVAAALRRVTGVSIAEGKFVFVRGLNERYTSSILNGSVIPSPAPLRKVAPLDLFPTSVLESTLVQKTWSPEFSAEFGGGVVDIRTKAVPLENFFEIGGSLGMNSEVTLQDNALLYDGGESDWLGYDDGERDLPAGLGAVFNAGTYNSLTNAERNSFSRALTEDSGLLVVQQGKVGPNTGVDASIGRRYDINNDLSMGVLGAVSYSNDWTTREGVQGIGEAAVDGRQFSGPALALSQFDRRATTNTVGANGLASIGFDIFDNHEVKFLAFGTRSTDKEAEVASGFTNDDDNIRRESIEWVERQLWTTQAQGEHAFPDFWNLNLDWRGSYSEANRDAPYQVNHEYELINEQFVLRRGSGVEFSEIQDDTTDFGVDLMLPLTFGDVLVDVKGGYAYVEKDRDSLSNFLVVPQVDQTAVAGLRVDSAYATLFADGTDGFQSIRSTQSPSFYIATQEVDAFYAGLDAQLTPFLRVAFGARYEDFIQAIETRTAPNTNGIITPPLEDDQVLPAATLTWNFADNLQLRLGYSETVNRPQFREIGPSRFTNTATNEQFSGNPFLKSTDITNFDARLEWYFGRDEFITIGAFAKELTRPIEAFNVGSGESRLVTFVNIDSADIQGIELEYQQTIPLPDWMTWDFLENKDFTINTNYTFSDSSIDAEEPVVFLGQAAANQLVTEINNVAQTTLFTLDDLQDRGAVDIRTADFVTDRQLQGQSEHLFNFQIGYKDFVANSDLNLLFNFQSERIRSVESLNDLTPAVIEEPPITLDLVYKRDFEVAGGQYQFGFKLNNILDEEYKAFQESGGTEVLVDTYSLGRAASVSLKRTF
ncbi:MAG: TonB-dependent receptor [Pseudomonadota bacterium]